MTKGAAARKLRETEEAQKAKDTDKAFKAKAAQEAQEARQQAEADKAWESREGRPGPSEDALWASYEKTKGANEVPDLEAEAGIQAGYKALAAKAKKAADARESQTDKAFKEKKAQEAEEARQQALRNSGFSKAEAERNRPDPERVKKAQEDAMWRQQEDGGGPQDWSDMDAIAAIQRELKGRDKASAILTKAPKLPKEPKEAKAPKETKVEPKAEEPQSLHDTIMDAAWKITGDTPGAVPLDKLRAALPNVPRAELDKAMMELQQTGKAGLSQYSSPRSITPSIKEAMVNYGGDDVHIFWPQGSRPTPEPLQIKVKPKKTAEEAPIEDTPSPDILRIRVGDQVVDRPKENIRNPMAYVAKTRKRMEERQSFTDELLDAAGERQKPIVDALLGRLNNGSKSFEDAYYHVEEAVNSLPEKQWGKFWDIYNAHEGRLKATYAN